MNRINEPLGQTPVHRTIAHAKFVRIDTPTLFLWIVPVYLLGPLVERLKLNLYGRYNVLGATILISRVLENIVSRMITKGPVSFEQFGVALDLNLLLVLPDILTALSSFWMLLLLLDIRMMCAYSQREEIRINSQISNWMEYWSA